MANRLGKRLKCSVCGAQVLVTKGGDGQVQCCGKDMEAAEAKRLPSAD